MSKKYLSLEEAANLLKISTSELMRMREQQEIRGFADRGNWKFKVDDVEALARTRMADSNPEVPLFADDEGDVGEQPTIISKGTPDSSESILDDDDDLLADSDSDVRLVGDSALDLSRSDSDVQLIGLDSSDNIPIDQSETAPEVNLTGSDSDVRLSSDDSDSDVSLMDSATITSFSMDENEASVGSDSDVQLVSHEDDASDVTLMGGDDAEAIPIDLSDDDHSVLADESGISLAGDSSLMLGGGSGISLEGPTDSGIELVADEDDEGITLDLGDDSGISLEMDESGISLEGEDFSGTLPMMDALSDDEIAETQFEIPPLDESDTFDIAAEQTGVLDMSDLDDSSMGDDQFDLDEDEDAAYVAVGEFEEDELDIEEDVFDDEGELDVFDTDDDVFGDEEVGVGGYEGRLPAADADWGTGTFVGLAFSSLLLLVCGVVMIDLVSNMASASSPNPLSSALLDALGGLYRG